MHYPQKKIYKPLNLCYNGTTIKKNTALMNKDIEEQQKLRQQKIEIAQKIYSIVNYNIPPEDDAGTIQNLLNLIGDLSVYAKRLSENDKNVNQQLLSL